jgi:hypothetical protein
MKIFVIYYSTSALLVLMTETYSVLCKIEVTQDIRVILYPWQKMN